MNHCQLKSGVEIPTIGLGTDGIQQDQLEKIIYEALKIGYKLFDTATAYGTQQFLSKLLKSNTTQKTIICTKFNNGDLQKEKHTAAVIETILAELEISTIDLILIHNPKVSDFKKIIKELSLLKKSGEIKTIGVSNFTIKHLDYLDEVANEIDVNQIELHPFLTQTDLITYCKKKDIKVMAYRPFAHGSTEMLNNSILQKIALSKNKTVSQIILRWIIQNEHVVIPGSSNMLHLKSNYDIFNFELNKNEISEISGLNKNMRSCFGNWSDFD